MITNTRTQKRIIADAMPGMIEASERRGQRELSESSQLPTEINAEDKAILEKAGVVFGPPTPGDELFCSATLPVGWKVQPTDHAMWSDLLDEKGQKRGGIFYKAAFYDRSARMYAVKETKSPQQ